VEVKHLWATCKNYLIETAINNYLLIQLLALWALKGYTTGYLMP
jgi:hypothetical protein